MKQDYKIAQDAYHKKQMDDMNKKNRFKK